MSYADAIGPLTLFCLMSVVGLQLTPADFRRVVAVPKAVVVGTLGQILLLPLMSWVLVSSLGLPPELSAGAMLLAASPGAGMSNVMAAIAGAHVALSVTLTAISSVLAVVTLPVITGLGLSLFRVGGTGAAVEVPVNLLFLQMLLFLLVPIGFGMGLRARMGDAVVRAIPWINRLALIGIVAVSLLSGSSGDIEWPQGSALALACLGSLLWTLIAMAIAWGLGTLLDLDADDRFTFLVEFSARNVALAFLVAVSSLGSLELGLFAGIYAFTGYPAVIGLSVLRGRWKREA